jgi:CysZ protein
MIKNSLITFKPAVQMITKDKVNAVLAMIPVLIGLLIFFFFGKFIYSELTTEGKKIIESYISEGVMGSVVYWLVSIILTVILYFIINFTFVLIVSLIASPFNDLLSARIEKKYHNEKTLSFSESLTFISGKIVATLFNEVKKISMIVVLSMMAFILSYIPLLTPFSIFINALLLAVGFVDYTWSRKNLAFSACLSDLRKNVFGYGLSGGFFFYYC